VRHIFEVVIAFLTKYKDAIEAAASAIATIAAIAKLGPSAWKKFRSWSDENTLRSRLGTEIYTREEITRATRYYIVPDCQDVDPGGSEDFRTVYSVRQNAFDALDKLLTSDPEHRHTILLADSGMGKTSLLMNYYARHQRSRSRQKRFRIALLPLGLPGVEERIAVLPSKPDTVLFLDAFDEDTKAISDHRQRLGALLKETQGFRHVLISCRTQFFLKEEEIPRETGLIRIGVTAAGESHEYLFYKIYLSPFSDKQVDLYLQRRFGLLHYKRRRAAKLIAQKMGDLTVRPMLLAHVPDLLGLQKPIQYSFEIYEEMLRAWINREKPFVADGSALREFSERLAVEIYVERKNRGSERITQEQLKPLAAKFSIQLSEWQLRGRSLLNRDAGGNLKFAHRSIMEYMFVCRFIALPESVGRTEWTEQMKRFWWEIASSYYGGWTQPRIDPSASRAKFGWDLADLSDVVRLGLYPVYHLRSAPLMRSMPEIASEWNQVAEAEINPMHAGLPHAFEVLEYQAPFEVNAILYARKMSTASRSAKDASIVQSQLKAFADSGAELRGAIRDIASGRTWFHIRCHARLNSDVGNEIIWAMSTLLFGIAEALRLPTTIEVLSLVGALPNPVSADIVREIFQFPGGSVQCADRDMHGLPYAVDWQMGVPTVGVEYPSAFGVESPPQDYLLVASWPLRTLPERIRRRHDRMTEASREN